MLALMAAVIYILLPQLGDFRSSWKLLGGINGGYAAVALALTAGTFVAGTGTYCLLAHKPLRYGRTLAVQLAATFVNRLLPAGIGALGANYLYLRHERHSSSQAGSVVAMNNLLGFTGHVLLVALVLILFSGTGAAGVWHGPDLTYLLKTAGVVLVLLVLSGAIFGRHRIYRAVSGLKKQLLGYGRRPLAVLAALMTSLTLTLCNVWCVFFCLRALHIHLAFTAVLLVFTLGLSIGSTIPTPGGLGGFEAGLAAGFVGYGIDPAAALAAALLYRLLSYWLPLITGAGAFVLCQRAGLFETGG